MRTSGILSIGGGLLAAAGAIFSLIMLKSFFVDKGQGFVDLSGLAVGCSVVAVGVAGLVFGRRQARIEHERDARNFSETAHALALKNNGEVALSAVCKATGLPEDEAQAKMRQLAGRGLFDLDFDGNGQMVYKLSHGNTGELPRVTAS